MASDTLTDVNEHGVMHSWSYGTIPEWRNYSKRVAAALRKAGIPNVTREKRVYYGNPLSAVWVVSFPLEHKSTATRVTDALLDPGTARRHRHTRALRKAGKLG